MSTATFIACVVAFVAIATWATNTDNERGAVALIFVAVILAVVTAAGLLGVSA